MKGSALMMCRNSERREEGTGSKKSSTTPQSFFCHISICSRRAIDCGVAEIFTGVSDEWINFSFCSKGCAVVSGVCAIF